MKLLNKKKILLLAGIALLSVGASACSNSAQNTKNSHVKSTAMRVKNKKVNYKKPSENKPYPKLNNKKNRIVVSIKKQKTYIQKKAGKKWKTVYTMLASTGSHNRTPRGQFKIQNIRGNYFYSPKEKEGAYNYVSWKDNGVYLFHSTPTNSKKQINQKIANDLGKKPSSHGCIHLTLADSKWLSQNAPVGMEVIIK